ncbi:glycine zipper 2TM domain-containing protein [Qipengyuania sediminis]|uniref:glycine zipper 2TM domain-containing protein n=1 Tax=Qipengyuania sediminis TaxID=1532023 RepID=UPI001059DC92|nr:glycine zipper 2TM domain-containing protein [Qipengyuania sediminis]
MAAHYLRNLTLALAAGGLTIAAPAAAYSGQHAASAYTQASYGYGDDDDDYKDRKGWKRYEREERRRARYASRQYGYAEPVYRDTRVWRGEDGRTYCRKSDGTTGLLIGGAAGALLGRELSGRRGDRTLGAILGAAGGALLGKSLDSKVRCN